MPSGHKAFLVHNPADVDLLLMHNKTFAAEYVPLISAIEEFDYIDSYHIGYLTQYHRVRGSRL